MSQTKQWLYHPASVIVQHLVFWIFSFLIFLRIFKTGENILKVDYVYTALFQLSLIPPVYINLKWFIPRAGPGNKWMGKIAGIIIVTVIFSWLNFMFFENWSTIFFPNYFFISYFSWFQVFLVFIAYLVITSLIKLSKSWFSVYELQKELLEKEKQKSEVELRALKAQINPHFFFNTLNNIYSMALESDDRLPATVVQLSDMMRYLLYESGDYYVPLAKELEIVANYISLQKIRSGDNLDIKISSDGDVSRHRIAPLLLITFLENAFKHGVKGNSGKTFVKFESEVSERQMKFTIENNKGLVDKYHEQHDHGLGLENIKRQLELLYPGKHTLLIDESHDRFKVELIIPI